MSSRTTSVMVGGVPSGGSGVVFPTVGVVVVSRGGSGRGDRVGTDVIGPVAGEWIGGRGGQDLPVRMPRVQDRVVRGAAFDHSSLQEHEDVVGEVPRRGKVVSDVEDLEVHLLSQSSKQSEDIQPDRDIQHGDRFVGHDDLGARSQARVIATRWRWPPDSSWGYAPSRRGSTPRGRSRGGALPLLVAAYGRRAGLATQRLLSSRSSVPPNVTSRRSNIGGVISGPR